MTLVALLWEGTYSQKKEKRRKFLVEKILIIGPSANSKT